MALFRLPREIAFPDPALADEDGLLAIGGDLSPRRLVGAYAAGIFPWYSTGEPILWWSPDPRFVLPPSHVHVSESLGKVLRRGTFEITADREFKTVVSRCASRRRPGQRGTWITPAMKQAYLKLHLSGLAHSIEAWREGRLVGGLYGVSLGGMFFGESMFADEPDASKAAFVTLCRALAAWDFDLVDCQMPTAHLARFGATGMPRAQFLALLEASLEKPLREGAWTLPTRELDAEPGP